MPFLLSAYFSKIVQTYCYLCKAAFEPSSYPNEQLLVLCVMFVLLCLFFLVSQLCLLVSVSCDKPNWSQVVLKKSVSFNIIKDLDFNPRYINYCLGIQQIIFKTLNISFFICKMEVEISTLWGYNDLSTVPSILPGSWWVFCKSQFLLLFIFCLYHSFQRRHIVGIYECMLNIKL